jgi:hypothetical protein
MNNDDQDVACFVAFIVLLMLVFVASIAYAVYKALA